MTIHSLSRPLIGTLLVGAVLAAGGCSWFRKGDRLYAGDAASRPLEVPPDLDLPRTGASGPAMASAVRPGVGTTSSPASGAQIQGFTVPGTRDAVFAQVGTALEGIDGVTITSRAQLVGAFDVAYAGSSFLVRVSEVEAGAYVSAVDPRGLAATGEAPARLIESLKGALGR